MASVSMVSAICWQQTFVVIGSFPSPRIQPFCTPHRRRLLRYAQVHGYLMLIALSDEVQECPARAESTAGSALRGTGPAGLSTGGASPSGSAQSLRETSGGEGPRSRGGGQEDFLILTFQDERQRSPRLRADPYRFSPPPRGTTRKRGKRGPASS